MPVPLFAFASTVRRVYRGPLAPFLDEFATFLERRGHPIPGVRARVHLIADLSRWLKRRGLQSRHLTHQAIDRFLRSRWRRMGYRRGERGRLDVFLDYLRQRGVPVPPSPFPVAVPRHPLELAYAEYLQKERALARATQVNYVPFVRRFLHDVPAPFRADRVVRFVLRYARTLNPGRAKLFVTALRSFFRFLRLRGKVSVDLAACVPTVPDWRLSTLPKSIPPEDVERVLAASDSGAPAGRRDQAILLLLARLGLRASEIIGLTLEDFDWETGEVTVRGKGGRPHRLPLPRDVGRALVAYLKEARPKEGSDRSVFLRTYPPFAALGNPSTVSTLVRRAITRAGLRPPRMGAHIFRHSLACQMLRRGATLSEIGQILRHRHPDTTAIYAKVDLVRLRPLAQPWPGGRP